MQSGKDIIIAELGKLGKVGIKYPKYCAGYYSHSQLISSELRHIEIVVIERNTDFIEIRFNLYNNVYFRAMDRNKIIEILSVINTGLAVGILKYHKNNYIYCSNTINIEILRDDILSKHLGSLLSAGLSQFEKILMVLTGAKNENITIAEAVARYFTDDNYFKNTPEKKIQGVADKGHSSTKAYSDEESFDSEDDFYPEDSDSDEEINEKIIKLDQDRLKVLIEDPEISEKLDKDFFFNESSSEYYYYRANTLGNRLKNYQPGPNFERSLLIFLQILYQKGLKFPKLPANCIMVEIHDSQIQDFTMAMHFYKKLQKLTPKSRLDSYMRSMKEDLSKLYAESYSKEYIFKYKAEESISIDAFQFKDLDNDDRKNGSGGFSAVYTNTFHNRAVVIKIPKETDRESKERVYREFQLTKSLTHKYIIKVLGITRYNNKECLVMEYVPGRSLRYTSGLNHGEKLKILEKVARAIEYLHSQNVCHYDIKPHNILMQESNPKIIDFGLAVVHKSPSARSGFTTEYADPRQYFHIDPGYPADIWAFGMTMYYLLIQKSPYYFIDPEEKKKERRMFFLKIQNQMLRPRFSQEFSNDYQQEEELMRCCWNSDFDRRIKASTVVDKLNKLL